MAMLKSSSSVSINQEVSENDDEDEGKDFWWSPDTGGTTLPICRVSVVSLGGATVPSPSFFLVYLAGDSSSAQPCSSSTISTEKNDPMTQPALHAIHSIKCLTAVPSPSYSNQALENVCKIVLYFLTSRSERNAASLISKSWFNVERHIQLELFISNCYAVSKEKEGKSIMAESYEILNNGETKQIDEVAAIAEMDQCSSIKSRIEVVSVPQLSLSSRAALLPHPSKVLTGGEGAYCKNWSFQDLLVFAPKTIEKMVKALGSYGCNNKSLILTIFLLNYLKSADRGHGSKWDHGGFADTAVYGVLMIGRNAFNYRGLFGVLRLVSRLGLSKECREKLDRLIGSMLDKAELDDLLISGHDEGVYDVKLVMRLVRFFVIEEEDGSSLMRMKKVGRLIDKYLRENSPDQRLKVSKFLGVADGVDQWFQGKEMHSYAIRCGFDADVLIRSALIDSTLLTGCTNSRRCKIFDPGGLIKISTSIFLPITHFDIVEFFSRKGRMMRSILVIVFFRSSLSKFVTSLLLVSRMFLKMLLRTSLLQVARIFLLAYK